MEWQIQRESISLDLNGDFTQLINKIKGLTEEEQKEIMENGGLSNVRNIMSNTFSQAQRDGIVNRDEYNKIPSEVIETIKANRNEDYEYELDDDLELKDQPMLPETKAILFNLFRDYFATPRAEN